MNQLAAVIFDMDGVLVDSEPLQVESFNEILKPYNIYISHYGFTKFVGRTQTEIFTELKESYGIAESVENLIARKRLQYLKLVNSRLSAMPGLYELIYWLKKMRMKIGVASSSPREDIDLVLKRIHLEREFDAILSAFQMPKGKPEPDVFLKTAGELQVLPSQCIVIEDTAVGVLAAKRANMRCIAMPNFFTKGQDFHAADYLVENLRQANVILVRECNGYAEPDLHEAAFLV